MARIEIILPPMGEGIIEADITKWLVNEGEQVNEDDPLVEVATDKVDTEIPSPADGVLKKILKQEGETPRVNEVIAVLETEGEETGTEEKGPTGNMEEVVLTRQPDREKGSEKETAPEEASAHIITSHNASGNFITPLVRNIAREEGLTREVLDYIAGSGMDGRITKRDIEKYIHGKTEGKGTERVPSAKIPATPLHQPSSFDSTSEIIEMDRMRRLIADHMVHSKHTAPHVTSFIDVDVTSLVAWRENVKNTFRQRENEKLTYTPIFIEAVAKALKEYPMINVSVDGYKIIRKSHINIGMATALPNGNLIVPVIKNADEMSLTGLTKKVNDLAGRARKNQLKPDEIQGGTFTLTNFGTFRSKTGTPIINQPEVAILGVGAIQKKPAVIETPAGDAIAIRHIMILSMSYDHRVVDGASGGMFLKYIADHLEHWDRNRTL